jgi:hypothetical protein
MSESNPQQKPSLARAKAILREQWPEVIQFLGDCSTQAITSKQPSHHSNPNESDSIP